jgi:hypothetical protein
MVYMELLFGWQSLTNSADTALRFNHLPIVFKRQFINIFQSKGVCIFRASLCSTLFALFSLFSGALWRQKRVCFDSSESLGPPISVGREGSWATPGRKIVRLRDVFIKLVKRFRNVTSGAGFLLYTFNSHIFYSYQVKVLVRAGVCVQQASGSSYIIPRSAFHPRHKCARSSRRYRKVKDKD